MIPLPIEQLEWLGIAGIVCFVPIMLFVIGILLCVWVYRDAESRGMSGVLWLIVVFLTNIVGLIIYLIVRKDKSTAPAPAPPAPVTRICPNCGRSIPPEVKFCPHCGKELA